MRNSNDKNTINDKVQRDTAQTDALDNMEKSINNPNNKEKASKEEKLKKALTVVALSFVVICVCFGAYIFSNQSKNTGDTPEVSVAFNLSKTIRINEYSLSNKNTLRDENWDSPDWIEIYNYGKSKVWLGDIYLSDSIKNLERFKLPDIEILPDSYLIVLASGKDITNSEFIHAPFRLGEDDAEILLYCDKQIIGKVSIEHMPQDISAGYGTNGDFGYFAEPTPGEKNSTQIYSQKDIDSVNSYAGLLMISEYLSNNDYGIINLSGEHTDWIEVYNPNEAAVFLGDFYLSDDEYSLNKYRLPSRELSPHEYIIIYASGSQIDIQDELSAPFGISADDSAIILSYKSGQRVDSIEVYDLPADISAGIDKNGGVAFFSIPTPLARNSDLSSSIMNIEPIYAVSSPLVINEWMSNNKFGILDAYGDASDWVEIYNPSDEPIALAGYALTDDIANPRKWIFPADTIIWPSSYILVYMSGKDTVKDNQLHASFLLGEDDTLYLTAPNTGIIDSAVMEYLPSNVSKGRTENGYGYFSLPTPNAPNTTSYATELKEGTTFLLTELYISEVASSNVHLARSRGKYTYEYIELYNAGQEKINLKGYSLEEKDGESFIFGDVSIRPNEYLVVSVKGYLKRELNYVKAENLSLNSAGESILLRNNEGITIDYFDTGYLLGDYSSGRILGDTDTRVFFTTKTPGEVNSDIAYSSYSTKPIFSHEGGMKDAEFYLTITGATDEVIYYTLDGSIPSADSIASQIYTQPIKISTDSIVRAITMSVGRLPSLCMSSTYILDRVHDIPIICLASEPAGLFSNARGIYADGFGHSIGPPPYFESNYFWNVERLVSFEYYNLDGTTGVTFDGGIQLAGAYSREHAQKSLVIRLRDEYGLSQVDFPFFDEGTTSFKHLLLRNSGQDHFMTKMRDAFILNCAQELGTVDCKRAKPVAVYINGAYWGYYNMRDKLNTDYFALKYGYDDDVVINMLTQYSSPKSGSADDWLDLKEFCYSNDFNIKENYDKLGERVDIDAFIDYFIVQIMFGNRDSHNIDFWKPEVDGGKWRPVLFDMDLALLPSDVNLVAKHLGNGNLGYHDHVRDALRNSVFFKEQFIDRCSYILTNIYTEEYLMSGIDTYKEQIQNEMVYHIQRWPYPTSYEKWESYVEKMRSELLDRRYAVPLEIQTFFGLDDAQIKELFPWYDER